MAKPDKPPAAEVPPPPLVLAQIGPVALVWDKLAMFRADEVAVYTTTGLGFARAVKYAWCMVPETVRGQYPSPESLAKIVPAVTDIWASVNAAIAAAGEEMSPKNVFGSTSGRGRASS